MIFIKVALNNILIRAMVDTGAQVSLISKKVAENCEIEDEIDTRFKVTTAGIGGNSEAIGKLLNVDLVIEGTAMPVVLTVMPNDSLELDMIMGIDILKCYQGIIDLQKLDKAQQTERIEKEEFPNKILYRTKVPEVLINPISLDSIDTSHYESADKVARYKCNCRYLWLRELHGVTAFMMSNSLKHKIFWAFVIIAWASYSIYNTQNIILQTTTLITILPVKKLKFPTLVFCPRNPDFLHYYEILEDMYSKLGYMENSTNFDILRYAITSFGFDGAHIERFNSSYLKELEQFYDRWKGNRSQYEMFEFVYEKHGYNCSDLFQTCYGGSVLYNCCDIFEPTYAMLRGKCYRLIDSYYQNDTDEVSKVSIFFKNIITPLMGDGKTPQLVLYNSDSNYEIGVYPRLFINAHDWNRLRFTQKSLVLLPHNDRCSHDDIYQGKFTCFVYKWLIQLINQYNCTVPYYRYKLHYLYGIPVCNNSVIVNNFQNISLTPTLQGYKCSPACSRIENSMQVMSSIDYDPDPTYMFRIEASFTYLEYEQYKEVQKTSTPGFISELGGQTGLFVGCSVMTIVQFFNSLCVFLYKKIRDVLYRQYYMVKFGLYTTHPSEPVDKFYSKSSSLERQEIQKAKASRQRQMQLDGMLFDEDPGETIEFEDVAVSTSSVGSEIERIYEDEFEEIPLSNSEELEEILPSTEGSSEQHSACVAESPEEIKIAKFVWNR
ncbi:unnamed protein product [Caenorhabditis bovis]|uniref:Peptidase A2 domain-containing protein n=1 Tax=Caenorhabditis bovis TaxID=2654633 RepID=A0A8S1F5R0_9PELO|nr:unnamed protein product [Caenorhabditis bovis]